MSCFKAADYAKYNHKFGFDKYAYLYSLMEEIFKNLPFDEKNYEDGFSFSFSGVNVFIDKKFNSYCEVLGSGWLSMPERIKIHKKKLKFFKQDIVQLTLF